jgi:hypothetical protein
MKEKNMKRNLVVLVLLVTWSLLSISPLGSAAYAGSTDGLSSDDNIVEVNGSSDDDTGGDPGDAGDGYGIADQGDMGDGLGGCNGIDDSIIDEYLLIMLSLIQLVL